MNKRVFNTLRKVAAEKLTVEQRNREPFTDAANHEYNRLLFRNMSFGNAFSPWVTRGLDLLGSPLSETRIMQARNSALALFPFGTDPYFKLVKHLKNYGDTKHYNVYTPENPKPMPVFDTKGMSENQIERLREMENGQANNRRRNPYSDVG